MKELLVSIWCTTYNHESYIKDTLEGFLAQKTSFKFEIIVHDDASTDRTAEIVREYENKYPSLIRGIYQTENQYRINHPSIKWKQDMWAANCRGKYTAFCEGDDFWIDMHKLQLQAEWLEGHPEFNLSVHNGIRWDCSENRLETMNPYQHSQEVSSEDIIMQYHGNVPTASMVVRTEMLKMEDFFLDCGVGDWPLQLYCITKGKVYYLSQIMSVYRSLHKGSWSVSCRDSDNYFEHCVRIIVFLKKYNEYTDCRYEKYLVSRIQGYVSSVLENNRSEETEEFTEKCDRLDIKDRFREHDCLEELKRLYRLRYDEKYYDGQIENFIKKHRYIVIFGAGNFGAKIAAQLKNHDVDFEGFSVSSPEGSAGKYLGWPVWKLSRIPFAKRELGVIVAIDPVTWNQLADLLEQSEIAEYICPFLLQI